MFDEQLKQTLTQLRVIFCYNTRKAPPGMSRGNRWGHSAERSNTMRSKHYIDFPFILQLFIPVLFWIYIIWEIVR